MARESGPDFGAVARDLQAASISFAALTTAASLFGRAVSDFREFEKQMVLTNAIAQGTVSTFNQMSTAARNFSLITTTSATEAGAALQQLAQAGFTAQESLSAMTGVLLLAQATMADVRVTSDVLSSNIRAFGLAATDSARIANTFAAAITGSLATMDKLAFAFRQVAPVAKLAGLSIEETTAALGVLFNVGLRGEQAGTALRNIIIRLVRPLGEAGTLLRDAGIATRETTGELRNLADILRDIGKSDLSNSDLARIFETEALAGVRAFIDALEDIDDTGKDAYERLRDSITETDRAIELAAANLNTLDGSLGLLKNTMSDAAKTLGEELSAPIRDLSQYIREVYTAFKDMDQAAQDTIVQQVKLGLQVTTIIGLFAGFFTLIRATGIFALAKLAWELRLTTAGLSIFAGAMSGTAASAIVNFTAAALSGAAGMTALALGMTRAQIAALGLGATLGLALPWIVAIGAAIAAGVYAFDRYRVSISEVNEHFDNLRKSAEFKDSINSAQDAADALLGKGTVEEITARVKAINDQMNIIRFSVGLEKSSSANRAQLKIKTQANDSFDALDKIRKEHGEKIFEYLRQREAYDKAIADYNANPSDYTKGSLSKANSNMIKMFEAFSKDEKATLLAVEDEYLSLRKANAQVGVILEEAERLEREGIREALQSIADGTADFGKDFEPAIAAIVKKGGLDKGTLIRDIVQRLAEGDKDVKYADVIREALEGVGFSADVIEGFMNAGQRARLDVFLKELQDLTKSLTADAETASIALLKGELELTETLTEGLRLATEIGNRTLEKDLSKIQKEMLDDFNTILVSFGVDQQVGMKDILAKALDATGFAQDFPIPPAFDDVISGAALIDAINKSIDESTTPEEAKRIIEEQEAKFKLIMEAYLAAVLNIPDGVVTEEAAAELRRAWAAATKRIEQEALEGIADTEKELRDQYTAQERRDSKAKSAADKAKREAEKRIKELEELEDAFISFAQKGRDANRAYLGAIRSLSPDVRAAFNLEMDIADIKANAEMELHELRREFEELLRTNAGDPETMARLNVEYQNLVNLIERARDAEIDATDDFSKQMDRRRDALQKFQEDLRSAAFESAQTFDKIAAGVGVAFAKYQENLVTLVDITSDAVTGFLDTATAGLADFIFDNENAWENFKKSMLKISREIFEGFTRAFLQQGISSLTGGEGSILGNALQPSKHGKTGTPGVGTGGGFLGKMLGGLLGIGGDGGKGSWTDANPLPVRLVGAGGVSSLLGGENGDGGILGPFGAKGGEITTSVLKDSAETLKVAATSLKSVGVTMAEGLGSGVKIIEAFGPKRPFAPNADITQKVAAAVEDVFGKGSKLVLTSGQEGNLPQHGSSRHKTGQAVDFGVFRPDGTRVRATDADATPFAMNAASRGVTGIGYGQEYMGGQNFHFDNVPQSKLGPGQGATWGSGGRANRAQLTNAMNNPIMAGGGADAMMGGAGADQLNAASQEIIGGMEKAGTEFQDFSTQQLPSALEQAVPDPEVLKAPMEQTGGTLQQDLATAEQQITGALNEFGNGLAASLNQIIAGIEQMASQAAGGGPVTFSGGKGATKGGGKGGGFLSSALGMIGSFFGFAEGGQFNGRGGPKDDANLIAVSDGEYIVNAKDTARNRGLLDTINAGDDPESWLGSRAAGKLGEWSGGTTFGGGDNGPAGIRGGSPAKPVMLNVTYNITGGQAPDEFGRSAAQHYKILAGEIQKARKNA